MLLLLMLRVLCIVSYKLSGVLDRKLVGCMLLLMLLLVSVLVGVGGAAIAAAAVCVCALESCVHVSHQLGGVLNRKLLSCCAACCVISLHFLVPHVLAASCAKTCLPAPSLQHQ
jgi:hypothetical protein